MKIFKKKNVYLFILLFLCYTFVNAQIKIYVSPKGDDFNPGTAEKPLASLTGARDAIRKYRKNHTSPVTFVIIISDGTYTMKEPFVLTPEDSGTPEHPVIYRAEEGATPVFSGGRKITGFFVNKNGIWEVKIKKSDDLKRRFDQLYVNDRRATLARTPNKGFLKISDVKQNILEKGEGRIPVKAQQILTFDRDNFKPLQKIGDDEIGVVRFRTYHKWDMTVRYIDGMDKKHFAISTVGRGMKPWNPIKKGGRIIFENYAGALDSAGEWYLNKDGILYYIPLPGQTSENTEVVAPVLENLVYIKGDISDNRFVEYIKFEGLTFKHCNYRMPPAGFEPNQSAVSINAAIMLEGARNIVFSDCEISHTGQHAIWFGKGCGNSFVRHCYLHELGGGGIYLGNVLPLTGAGHTHNITVDNNIIQSGGKEFPPAVGIWIGNSSDNMISHNDIGNFYYTGISAGWVWGYKPSLTKRNKIIYNHIHHIGWALLSDMAAVYTLGKSDGTIISNNLIHHIHAYSYGGWGLYTDEGSSNIIMENNLVCCTKTGGFHQHYGENNTLRNNIFAYSKLYQIQCTRVEKHLSFNFTNNIIIFDRGVVLKGPWNKINVKMDYNIYWNTGGNTYDFCGYSFEKWRKQTGHDTHSFIGNPDFKDAPKFNFRFNNDKDIKKIKFRPFDYSKAGVYGSKEWRKKALLKKHIILAFDKAVEENMKKNISKQKVK